MDSELASTTSPGHTVLRDTSSLTNVHWSPSPGSNSPLLQQRGGQYSPNTPFSSMFPSSQEVISIFFLTTSGGSRFCRRWVHSFEGPSPPASTRHPAHFHSMYPPHTTLSHPYVTCCTCCSWLATNHVSCQHSINGRAVTHTDLRHTFFQTGWVIGFMGTQWQGWLKEMYMMFRTRG